jgi:hypothetical protein
MVDTTTSVIPVQESKEREKSLKKRKRDFGD